MRFMVIVKADKTSEAGEMPTHKPPTTAPTTAPAAVAQTNPGR